MTPTAMQAYRAPLWLPGGHLQTIWPALMSHPHVGSIPPYRRERWSTPDDDFIDIDWLESAHWSPGTTTDPTEGVSPSWGRPGTGLAAAPRSPPLLLLFHGLEGSSRSRYALAFAEVCNTLGWRYAVAHFRGCSGELNRAPRAYHSGDFQEIGWILERVRKVHRGPVLAVGISLGGNALLRWAQEAGGSAARTVSAVAAVSAPIDLTAGGHAIGRGFNRQAYTRMFLRSMKPKALAKLQQFPGLFSLERLQAAHDLYAFDNVFTAPLHGFRNTDDYWARASAKPHLPSIRIPALVLNALNDPFVPAASLPSPEQAGQYVTLWQPAHGGHVGFAAGPAPAHTLTMPRAVTSWLATHL